jgi:hypothetical protein
LSEPVHAIITDIMPEEVRIADWFLPSMNKKLHQAK